MRSGKASAQSLTTKGERGSTRRLDNDIRYRSVVRHRANWCGAHARRTFGQQPTDGVVRLSDERRSTGLEDAGFFNRNLFSRRPEILGVVYADRSHAGGEWREDVGRVEPPAKSNLDDGDIHVRGRK